MQFRPRGEAWIFVASRRLTEDFVLGSAPMTSAPRAALVGPFLLLTACFSPGEGQEPPLDRFYFPTGLAVDSGAERLYVVNSDFDLQYNGGSLQSLDLDRLREVVPRYCRADDDCGDSERCDLEPTVDNEGTPSHWCVDRSGDYAGKPCGPLGEKSQADRWLEPGRCDYLSVTRPQDGGESLVVGRVGVGAFATDVIYRQARDADGEVLDWGRLFVPVRGDATLHYIDVEPGGVEVECGQDGNHGDCNDAHRVGNDPDAENTRDLRMPPEPFAIDASEDGTAVLVTHQVDGAVSLFLNDWTDRPRLEWVTGGLPARIAGIAAVPEPVIAQRTAYQPGFLVTFRVAANIVLLRVFEDASSSDSIQRPYLQQSGSVSVAANSVGFDSRGVAVDASERRECERGCADDACLSLCAGIPLGIYVGNRSPNSLLVGQSRTNASATSSDDLPTFYDSIPMPFGVSRVVVGPVIDPGGALVTRVFVISFDQRKVAIYDPEARRVEGFVETGRGPHALVIDADTQRSSEGQSPRFAYGYLAHFTDSYIGVIDLDQRHETYGQIVLTVGAPTPPRASK